MNRAYEVTARHRRNNKVVGCGGAGLCYDSKGSYMLLCVNGTYHLLPRRRVTAKEKVWELCRHHSHEYCHE